MKNLLNIELDLNDWDDSSSECMHKKCLFDKAVELLAIFWKMKCFLSSVKLVLPCGNFLFY